MHGDKRYIKLNNVLVIQVPQYQYKGLYAKDIMKFARSKIKIDDYLPEFEYNKEPNRQWLCNVVNSLILEDFQSFIDEQVNLGR